MLDPVADRLVLVTAVIAIAVYGAVPGWLAGLVLGRELLVSVAVLVLAALGAKRIDVLWVGKAGTFGLFCCFPLFLLGDEDASWAHVLTDVTWVAVVPALILSFVGGGRVRASRPPSARRAPGRGPGPARAGGFVKAVIMAGGEGTRLRPLTANQPKPMLPMANAPMAEQVVHLLRRHGFEEIVVTVGFLASTIRTYFGDGSELGVRLVYATEETPLGTAGSVLNARDELDDRFLVISGDVLTDVDLTALVEFHDKQGCRRHPRPASGGEPARVRDRHHRRRRSGRALPRETGLGRSLQRHHQHGHLRARARGLRLDPDRAGGRLLVRGVPARCSRPGGRCTDS